MFGGGGEISLLREWFPSKSFIEVPQTLLKKIPGLSSRRGHLYQSELIDKNKKINSSMPRLDRFSKGNLGTELLKCGSISPT